MVLPLFLIHGDHPEIASQFIFCFYKNKIKDQYKTDKILSTTSQRVSAAIINI